MSEIIHLSSSEPVDMADEWYELASPEHFWMQWRFRIIEAFAPLFLMADSRILEIGCGHGAVLKQFESAWDIQIEGCDLNLAALEAMGPYAGKRYLYNIADLHPQLTGKYDTLLLLDVIEHIEEDVDFLQKACAHLKEVGYVLLNVPALPRLYSAYDERAGHKRRYTASHLKRVLQKADLEMIGIQYWGMSLLPLGLVRKQVLRWASEEKVIQRGFQVPHPWLHQLLKAMMCGELALLKKPLLGTSLMALGKWVKAS